MKSNSPSKGQLIDWLENVLDKQLYPTLRWTNKQKRIFYIQWTHKSAEHWSVNILEPFEAWAIHKGKREGKNDKQLKATFRCALKSKKEHLAEISKSKDGRYWQFLDGQGAPEPKEKTNPTKRKRKINSESETDIPSSNNTYFPHETSLGNSSSSEAEILTPKSELPSFETFCSFACLTPPPQAGEISYICSDPELSRIQDSNSKESFSSNCDISIGDRISNAFAKSSSFGDNGKVESPRSRLPSFETFRSSALLTPPPSSQTNEIICDFSELITSCSPSPDPIRQTPPLEDNAFPPNTDVLQPNYWTASLLDLNNFNHFPNNCEDMYNRPTMYGTNHNRMEMDQFVPVMSMSQNDQMVPAHDQYNYGNRTSSEASAGEPIQFDEDYLLSDDVDQEACERIVKELERLTPPSKISLYRNNN